MFSMRSCGHLTGALVVLGLSAPVWAQQTTDPLPGLTFTFGNIDRGTDDRGFPAGPVLFAEEVGVTNTTGLFELNLGLGSQRSTATSTRVVSVTVESVADTGGTLGTLVLYDTIPGTGGASATVIAVSNPYTVPSDRTINSLGLLLPVTFEGCSRTRTNAQVKVTVEINTGVSTANIQKGEQTIDVLQCVNAYSVSLVDDATAGGADSGYEYGTVSYNTTVSGPPTDRVADGEPDSGFNDTAAQATHGLLQVSFDPDRAEGGARNIYTDLNAGPLTVDTDGDAVTGWLTGARGEITEVSALVDVPSDVVSVGLGAPGAVLASVTPIAGQARVRANLSYVALRNNPYSDGLVLTLSPQTVNLAVLPTSGVFLLEGAVTFQDTISIGTLNDEFATAITPLDALDVYAARCGRFDWVADSASSPWGGNTFRITGHGANVTAVIARFTNSMGGGGDNAYDLDVTSLNFSDPVVEISEANLAAANSGFGVADVELLLVGALPGTDCDRLLRPRATDLLFSFGNDRIGVVDDGDD